MPDRSNLAATFWLASSLALLASVLVAPTRASVVIVSSQSDCLRRNCTPSHGRPTPCLRAAVPTDDVPPVNALPAENEEQERADALDEPRVSLPIACSRRQVVDRRLITPRSIPPSYPLRC